MYKDRDLEYFASDRACLELSVIGNHTAERAATLFFTKKMWSLTRTKKKSSNFIHNFYPQISPILDVFFSRRRSKKKCSHWQGPKKNHTAEPARAGYFIDIYSLWNQKKIIPWNQRGLDTHRYLFLVYFLFFCQTFKELFGRIVTHRSRWSEADGQVYQN